MFAEQAEKALNRKGRKETRKGLKDRLTTEAQRGSGIIDPLRMPFRAGGWMEKQGVLRLCSAAASLRSG